MSRNTVNANNHNHNFAGSSHNSNSILSSVGGGQVHENRPEYFVIQYVIYLKKVYILTIYNT